MTPLLVATRTNSASTWVRGLPANEGGGAQVSSGMRNATVSIDAMVAAGIFGPLGGRACIFIRHSGAAPTGPACGRPDDRLRAEPGIQTASPPSPQPGFRVREALLRQKWIVR